MKRKKKTKVTQEFINEVKSYLERGHSKSEAARFFGCSPSTLFYIQQGKFLLEGYKRMMGRKEKKEALETSVPEPELLVALSVTDTLSEIKEILERIEKRLG